MDQFEKDLPENKDYHIIPLFSKVLKTVIDTLEGENVFSECNLTNHKHFVDSHYNKI